MKRMRWFFGVLAALALAGAWFLASPPPERPIEAAVAQTDAPAEHSYSPFVLQMQTALPFEQISFKDVGMSVDPSARHLVYEEVAQSLSVALASHEDLPMSSEVLFSAAAADPSNHVACGASHIYVDVWAPEGQEGWGYSLWSGCGEEDRFAYREIPRTSAEDVDALTRDIAASLREAVAARCFTRSC